MKRLFFLPLLLLFTTELICDVWYYDPDPQIMVNDWRADEYYYYDWEAYNITETITSPFYQIEASHLNAINQEADSDFQPEDGWCLYAANFGEQPGTGSGFPLFALYNKYTGVLRVFIYKTNNAPESYTYIAVELTYNGNSALFSLGEEELQGGIKALDKRDELGECSFVTFNEMGTSYNNWFYIDVNVMYDPVERIDDPSIFIRLYGSEESSINSDIDLCGQFSSTNISNSNSVIDLGNSLYTHYKDGASLGEQIQNHLENQYINVTELDITPQNEIFSLLTQADIVTELLGGANSIYGLFKFLTAGGGGSNVSSLMYLHGAMNGTMETINNLKTSDIFESISGRTVNTNYSETMGVFNLLTSPQVEHATVMYGNITGAHTYRVTSEELDYIINPNCGLNTTAVNMEAALEFDVSFINGHWSWIEEATGYTFDEMIELGCFTEIGTTFLGNGIRTRYRTQFVPAEDLNGLTFTVPFTANSVSLKVKTVVEKDDNIPSDNIVIMTNYAVDLDHVGSTNEFFAFIPEQQVYTIYETVVITDQVVNINNVYNIEYGSDLRFENCTINMEGHNYGFNVKRGQLIFNNCTIDTDNNFIRANGGESEVIIESGSVLNFNQGTIELSDNAHLYVEDSIINLEDMKLELKRSSRVNLTDNCELNISESSEIVGSTSGYWFDPVEYDNGSYPPEFGEEIYMPGDRIYIENSRINFANDTEIKGKDGYKWDGIYFMNCDSDCQHQLYCGQMRGTISDIHRLDFSNSVVNLEDMDISNIGQMTIHDNSIIYLDYTNYHHNLQGIFSQESAVRANASEIHHNGGNGLTVINSLIPQSILVSEIYENEGIGLDIHNCFFYVNRSEVYNNQSWGVVNLGSVQNLINSNSKIYNNGHAEVAAIATSFPHFQTNLFGTPHIFDDEISSDPTDQYLLMALGPVYEPIDVVELMISTDDESRFYPSFDDFIFNNEMNYNAYLLYLEGLGYCENMDYETAYFTMKQVIELYPESVEAKNALAMLPYLCKASAGSQEELVQYIEELQSDDLEEKVDETKAIIAMFNADYVEAISLFEEIISDPPGEYEQLMAELNEAYCYFKLVNSGYRDTLPESHHKPENSFELAEIRNEIRRKILFGNYAENEMTVPELQIIECSNYPNPFNPSTTIEFSLNNSLQNRDVGNLEITIYNLKGQKVKDLPVNKILSKENKRFSAIWNGTDSENKSVSSGVYFYQISLAGKSETIKKCILMK